MSTDSSSTFLEKPSGCVKGVESLYYLSNETRWETILDKKSKRTVVREGEIL